MKTHHAVNAMLTKKDDSGKTYVAEIGVRVPSLAMSLRVSDSLIYKKFFFVQFLLHCLDFLTKSEAQISILE